MAVLSVWAKLGLDKTGFDAGISKAQSSVVQFGSNIKAQLAGAFSAAAVAQYLHGLTETVGRIKDLSEQYGITAEEVQRTDFALKQSGLQFEDLSSAIIALGRNRREAGEGNRELEKTFLRFGITLQDIQNPAMRTYDILLKIADAQRGHNLTAKEQVSLMDMLGPRAGKLVNIIGELGQVKIDVISDAAIEKIDSAVKYLERFKQKLDQIAATKLATILQLAEWLPGIGGGREQMAADLANAIGGALKPIANKGAGGILNLAGAKPPKVDNLWDIKPAKLGVSDKNQSDQFQRIGAFTGRAAQASQLEVMKRQQTVLEQMRDALVSKGILIRGTD